MSKSLRQIAHFGWRLLPATLRISLKSSLKRGLTPSKRRFGRFEFIWSAVRSLFQEIQNARIVRNSQKALRELRGKKNIKVHLGCGYDVRPGWVNMDLSAKPIRETPGATFIGYDLRLGLPLPKDSCSLIYSSHFMEHLEYRHGFQMIRDCHRALQSGGVFRACLPNFRGLFEAYVRGDEEYMSLIDIRNVLPEIEVGTEMFVDHINYGAYQGGEHKWIFDEEKMLLLLRRAGFQEAVLVDYDENIDVADPVRRRYSFYVEARK